MNKSFFLIGFFLLSSYHTVFSQSLLNVSGTVMEAETPIPFATVFVKNTRDSTISKYGITDTLGAFSVTGVSNGMYFLEVNMVGYENYYSEPFELTTKDLNMGTIPMRTRADLDVIEVVQVRPIIEVLPDKTVLNVDNTINATGTNAFELLRKAPGVVIDNNNNIIVEGKSGTQIYIDGKPSVLAGEDLINYLKTLQATDIDKLEIITQPSSRYDAAGNAGIINIILKRDKNIGTNGSLTLGHSYGQNHRFNSSLSLNHRNKAANIYGSYSNNLGKNASFFDNRREQFGFVYDSETDNLNDNNGHNAKIGADWFVKPKHTIGVLLSGNYFDTEGSGYTYTTIGPVGAENPNQILIADNTNQGLNYQYTANVNYRFADTNGREFSMDADYGNYIRDAQNYQPNLYLDGETGDTLFENNYRMFTPTDIEIITGKVDYAQNLWKGKFSIGAKYSLVRTDNTFEFYDVEDGTDILNEDRSNRFKYDENINAAYINYAQKLNQKWSFQLGLRGEQTNSRGELISTQMSDEDLVQRNYLNLFPSGGLTYVPSWKNSFSLTFGRRIQRPNYQGLNPFENQLDELSFMKGNPFLQPQYTYNVKLSHTFMYRFSTSVSYSYTEDFFAQITDTLGTTRSFLISRNVADQQTVNFNVSLPIEIKKWWSVYLNGSVYHTAYFGTDEQFQAIDQWTGSFFAQSTFLLPAKFKLEVSGWFNSPSIWGGTYRTQSLGSLDLAVERKFLKDKLTARIAGSDLFYTSPWKADYEYGELSIFATGGWESRRIAFSISYNFGNQEMKGSRKRETGLEEEGKRTGN